MSRTKFSRLLLHLPENRPGFGRIGLVHKGVGKGIPGKLEEVKKGPDSDAVTEKGVDGTDNGSVSAFFVEGSCNIEPVFAVGIKSRISAKFLETPDDQVGSLAGPDRDPGEGSAGIGGEFRLDMNVGVAFLN